MRYRKVGNTGLWVSELAIGGWLTLGKSVDDRTSHDILHEAIAAGINFIDVADIYATGESERVTGEVISEYKRSDLVVSSKVFWPMSENINDRGLSRKHIMESIDKSLERLQTDYLDIYFCHRWDEETPLLETMRAMDDLVRSNKILYWGTSMWSADQLRQAHELAERYHLHPPVVEQPRYNLLHREIEQGVQQAAVDLGMGLTVWSPLAQGLLTGKYNDGVPADSRGATQDAGWLKQDMTSENLALMREYVEIARKEGLRPEVLALAWLLTREGISSVLTGATKPSHLQSNLEAVGVELDAALIARLDKLFVKS